MMQITEGSSAIPTVLFRVLAVHLATFINLDLVLDQFRIVLQLL